VTANNRDTFEESLSALSSSTLTITGITQADPAVITLSAAHTLEYGDEIYIDSVVGMTQLNGRRFLVLDAPSSTTIEIMSTSRAPIDSTGYGAYVSGGSVRTAFVTAVATAQAWDNTITWAAAADADTYNVYRADESGLYGFIGRTDSLTFTDDFIEADTGDTAPLAANPFEEGAGFWPSTTGFFQQRQIYANSDAFPNRFWMTQTGVFYNFATSTPLRDDDAIIATLAARRINEIRHIIPLSDLVILTTGAEFRVKGQGDAAFTPSTINIKPQSYYGSTALRPIVAGDVALYMAPGNFIRELSYEFATDKFTGRDITVLARHLLDYNDIVDWDFAPSPYDLIWLVRDDGTALVLTYQNEQEVYAWTRATTLGDFKSVAVVREGDKDIAYFVVRRTINGTVKQFVERLDEREFADLQDAFCVDAGLSLDVPITITNMTAADPVVVTAPAHGLSNGDIVDISDVLEVSSNNTRREVASADYTGTGFIVANATTNTFELNLNGSGYDGSGFAAYSSGGVARKAVTTLSGLSHLEGAEVVAAANGYAETGLVVSGGSITLSTPASRVHVGLPYTCQMITLPISTYGSSRHRRQAHDEHQPTDRAGRAHDGHVDWAEHRSDARSQVRPAQRLWSAAADGDRGRERHAQGRLEQREAGRHRAALAPANHDLGRGPGRRCGGQLMIRDLTHDDLPQLLELAREMHRTGVYAAYPMDEARVAYILTRLIEVPEALSIGYESNGELVGAFVGEIVQDLWVDVRVAADHAFYVREADRGSRAGVMLLRAFEKWASENGADVLRPVVYAGVDNQTVNNVLQRMGYESAGTVHKKEAA
jgi:GNAT superfamily N-acetyltransferase